MMLTYSLLASDRFRACLSWLAYPERSADPAVAGVPGCASLVKGPEVASPVGGPEIANVGRFNITDGSAFMVLPG